MLARACALTLLLACIPVASPAVVVNGDFEGGWYDAVFPSNGCVGNGWVYYLGEQPPDCGAGKAGDVFFRRRPEGSCVPDPQRNDYQRIFVDQWQTGRSQGGIYQVIPVTPGKEYLLEFHLKFYTQSLLDNLSARYGIDLTGGTDYRAGTVQWDPGGGVPPVNTWSNYQVRFTATGSSVTVFFHILLPCLGSGYLDVDEVRLIEDPLPPIRIIEGPKAVRQSDTSYVIRWRTDVPAASRVEYSKDAPSGDDGPVYNLIAQKAALTTEHEVVLSGLSVATTYHFRVLNSAPGRQAVTSLDRELIVPTPPLQTLQNPSFEDRDQFNRPTLFPWQKWDEPPLYPLNGLVGPYPATGGWAFSGELANFKATDGSYFFGFESVYIRKGGGIYQRVRTSPGEAYKVSFDFATCNFDPHDSTPPLGRARYEHTQAWVGLDPTGNTDPFADTVRWKQVWTQGYSIYPTRIVPQSATSETDATVAEGDSMTVFVRFLNMWPWRNSVGMVDNLRWIGPPAVPPDVTSVGRLKQMPQFSFAELTQSAVVTLVPWDAPGVFYIQDPDGTAGIRVEANDSSGLSAGPAVARPCGSPPCGWSASAGTLVRVKGTLTTTAAGEPVLRNAVFTTHGAGQTVIRHLGLRHIGGTHYQGAPSVRLSTSGLLVQVTGRVTAVDYMEGFFLLDDGSEIPAPDHGGPNGVRVRTTFLPAQGQFVTLVGVVSTEDAGGVAIPVIRTRDDLSELAVIE